MTEQEIVKDPPIMPELLKIIEKKELEDIRKFQKERNKHYSKIEEFLANHKAKIFGNMAYIKYLQNSDPLGIREYYYSAFVQDARKLSTEISNILFKLGLPLVELAKNYDGSYTIKYNGQKCCVLHPAGHIDYTTLETIKDKSPISGKELMYVSPEILNIEILRKITNPRIYISEWEYLFEILNKSKVGNSDTFSKSLPRKIDFNKLIGAKPKYFSIIQTIFNLTKINDFVIVGIAGYLQFMRNSGKSQDKYFRPRLNVYEILSKEPNNDIKKIKEYITGKCGNELKIKQSDFRERKIESFIGIHPDKYSLYFRDTKIVDLYDISKEYVPFVNINGTKYGNLDLIKRFLLIGIYVSYKIKGGESLRERNTKMILELITANIPENITRPYEIKQLFGNIVIPDRQFKIRRFDGKEKSFIYKPEIYFKKFGKLLS